MNCVIIVSGNGLPPVWHRAPIWINIDPWSIWTIERNFSDFWSNIEHFFPERAPQNVVLDMSAIFSILNVLLPAHTSSIYCVTIAWRHGEIWSSQQVCTCMINIMYTKWLSIYTTSKGVHPNWGTRPIDYYIIPPWTKWPPFPRRHFQMHFRELKVCS